MALTHLPNKYSLVSQYMKDSVLSSGDKMFKKFKIFPCLIKIESSGEDRHRTGDHKWSSK